jgi:hypothetical protein
MFPANSAGFQFGRDPDYPHGTASHRHRPLNLFYYDPRFPIRRLRHRLFAERRLTHRVTTKLIKELRRRVMGMGPLFECCVSPPAVV